MNTTTIMMNPVKFQGQIKAQSGNGTESKGAFQSMISEQLSNLTSIESSVEGLNLEQMMNMLEEFRLVYNQETGENLSLDQLIQQIKKELGQADLSSTTSLPDVSILIQQMGISKSLISKETTMSSVTREEKLISKMQLAANNQSTANNGVLHELMKFMKNTSIDRPLPILQNIKQLLSQIQEKPNQSPQSMNRIRQTAISNANQPSLYIHTKNQQLIQNTNSQMNNNGTLLSNEPTLTQGVLTSTTPSLMSKVEQLVIHAPQDGDSHARFTNEIAKVMNRGRLLTLPNGSTQISIKLFPENLGALDVQIVQRNGEIAAKIIASTAQAKELIETNLNQLRHVLQGQNVTVNQIEVSSQTPDWMNDSREKGEQHASSNKDRDESRDEEENEPQSFQQWLDEMEIEVEV
ncbi:flagellar hook-length control protein FliK [Pseudalkalibacillus berkeleyi]|uniref:Flagellar hook-length control protein FliK n=1 Tax=Pseudalkalibacillus berkeleyi TaxID=1069813 RepID=A0ABS9H0D0_9BACL|nr:flagellar hook-length control protein FliK [Pseudalkalibacillus berkeleyi]MCF6137110.1 flagellar hook-length control protein FliK [Pseudalkalibacillus berkeleyi]